MPETIDKIDAKLKQAREAGDTPAMLHLAEDVYKALKVELRNLPSDARVAYDSISRDASVALQFRGLACRQYEELPAGWIVVVRKSEKTQTLLGMDWKRVAVPETAEGQDWINRHKRKRRIVQP